jgi:tetratricopeptide (TPR) repeat protein
LALLAKPQVIAFPFLLFLWDYWPLGRIGAPVSGNPAAQGENASLWTSTRLVWEKVPLLLLSAASAMVTMKAQGAAGAIQPFSKNTLFWRLENAAISYVLYLGKAVWPSKLSTLYVHRGPYPLWQAGAALFMLLLVTACVLRARDQRYLAVGWFWFLGSLIPMIGLVQVGSQSMADRYAYISFLGLFVMLTWLAADWTQTHRLAGAWRAVPAVACLLVLGTLTYRQVGYWKDTESVWLRTLAVNPNNYVAETSMAGLLFSEDQIEAAGAHYRAALAILPNGPTATLGLGDYEERRGDLPRAIEQYEKLARATDVSIRATGYDRLGFAYRKMGASMKAKQCFEITLQLAPDRARAMTGLGLIAQEGGDLPEAIRQYSHAVAAEPTDSGYLLLAQALQKAGRPDEARAIYQRVAQSSLDLAAAQKTAEAFLSPKTTP